MRLSNSIQVSSVLSGAHVRYSALVSPQFCVVSSHVRKKMRLAGHRSRSFAVKMSQRIAVSPASVCYAMPGYGITDPPMAAVTASGCLTGPESQQPAFGSFLPSASTWRCQPEYPSKQIACRNSGRAQHGKSKVWSYFGLSVDCLLTKGLAPQIWNDALMRTNDQAQRPPPETPGRLQQSRANYLNRPTAQRGGGSLQRSG
jgi:hypothetical protein